MKSSCVFAVVVLIVVSLTWSCHGQIHYTPDWGHGKRSLASQFVDSGSDSMVPCLEQTELNLLLEVAKILTCRLPDKCSSLRAMERKLQKIWTSRILNLLRRGFNQL